MLQSNIAARHYCTPTPIQDRAIGPILEGKDLIGLANTGTGKTAAFVLPIIERTTAFTQSPSTLIVVPTRELALQIETEFRSFAQGLHIYTALCVGGMNINRQIDALRRRPQVVIGTPGRLKDLIERRNLQLQFIKILVLDEADRMCDMGFIADIRYLLNLMPTNKQTLCLSATMTPSVEQLMTGMLHNPVRVTVQTANKSEQINQEVIRAESESHKFSLLTGLLNKPDFDKVLIFGRTKRGVQNLAHQLTKTGLAAEAIHGNKSQPQRQRSLQAFRNNAVQILVATDVAARGLDIPDVSHVINFDQPMCLDDYTHRIGRTGRAGKTGQAITFV